MSLGVTGAIVAVALVFGVFCAWRGARPSPVLGHPRMIPWRFLMLASLALVIVALVHIVALIRGAGA